MKVTFRDFYTNNVLKTYEAINVSESISPGHIAITISSTRTLMVPVEGIIVEIDTSEE